MRPPNDPKIISADIGSRILSSSSFSCSSREGIFALLCRPFPFSCCLLYGGLVVVNCVSCSLATSSAPPPPSPFPILKSPKPSQIPRNAPAQGILTPRKEQKAPKTTCKIDLPDLFFYPNHGLPGWKWFALAWGGIVSVAVVISKGIQLCWGLSGCPPPWKWFPVVFVFIFAT